MDTVRFTDTLYSDLHTCTKLKFILAVQHTMISEEPESRMHGLPKRCVQKQQLHNSQLQHWGLVQGSPQLQIIPNQVI